MCMAAIFYFSEQKGSCHFLDIVSKLGGGIVKTCTKRFTKIGTVTAMVYWQGRINFYTCFNKYCPILVKTGTRDLHIMPFSILWFSPKCAQERPYFSFAHKLNYIYVCTVKPYNVLNVQNTLVNYVYYNLEFTICNNIELFIDSWCIYSHFWLLRF
jgi:hypothetical protein